MAKIINEKGMVRENYHLPVFLKEAVDFLKVEPGRKYIDTTLGGGGHTIEILKMGGRVLGIDCDPEAINYVWEKLKTQNLRRKINLILERGNFKDLRQIALSKNFLKVAGIIFDLGVSQYQLLTPERGFSFLREGPLDMRMDPSLAVKAADLVNGLGKGELYELFYKLGEEGRAWAIAQAIVRARAIKPIKTTKELGDLVAKVYQGRRIRGKIHPATRVFQALRIAVNDELNNLRQALPQAQELLPKKGRLVVISFHSLEDRLVKQFFKKSKNLKALTKHPLRPTQEEIIKNPSARSAKLRVAEKI